MRAPYPVGTAKATNSGRLGKKRADKLFTTAEGRAFPRKGAKSTRRPTGGRSSVLLPLGGVIASPEPPFHNDTQRKQSKYLDEPHEGVDSEPGEGAGSRPTDGA